MTITRRTVIAGLGAAAVAPMLPPVQWTKPSGVRYFAVGHDLQAWANDLSLFGTAVIRHNSDGTAQYVPLASLNDLRA